MGRARCFVCRAADRVGQLGDGPAGRRGSTRQSERCVPAAPPRARGPAAGASALAPPVAIPPPPENRPHQDGRRGTIPSYSQPQAAFAGRQTHSPQEGAAAKRPTAVAPKGNHHPEKGRLLPRHMLEVALIPWLAVAGPVGQKSAGGLAAPRCPLERGFHRRRGNGRGTGRGVEIQP